MTHSYERHDLLTAVGLGECVLQGVLYRGPSSGAGVCVEREGGVCVESGEAEEEMSVGNESPHSRREEEEVYIHMYIYI